MVYIQEYGIICANKMEHNEPAKPSHTCYVVLYICIYMHMQGMYLYAFCNLCYVKSRLNTDCEYEMIIRLCVRFLSESGITRHQRYRSDAMQEQLTTKKPFIKIVK